MDMEYSKQKVQHDEEYQASSTDALQSMIESKGMLCSLVGSIDVPHELTPIPPGPGVATLGIRPASELLKPFLSLLTPSSTIRHKFTVQPYMHEDEAKKRKRPP